MGRVIAIPTAEDPQDKKSFPGFTSHAEKVFFFFKEAIFASEEAEAKT